MPSFLEMGINKARSSFPLKHYFDMRRVAHLCIGEKVTAYLPKERKILDVGSGPGDTAGVLTQLDYEVWACDDLQDDWHLQGDNQEKILQYAAELGIKFHLMTNNDIPFENNSFDMVMCNAVFEHLHDSPRELANKMMELLKPNGLFFMTVPNAVNIRKRLDVMRGKTNLPPYRMYYWHPGKSWRGHVREYVRDDLVQLAEFLDLEVLEIAGIDIMLDKLPKSLHPLYLAVTKFFDSWKDSWVLVGKKKPGWIEKVLSDDELAQLWGSSDRFE